MRAGHVNGVGFYCLSSMVESGVLVVVCTLQPFLFPQGNSMVIVFKYICHDAPRLTPLSVLSLEHFYLLLHSP